jgi:hypothetical protein
LSAILGVPPARCPALRSQGSGGCSRLAARLPKLGTDPGDLFARPGTLRPGEPRRGSGDSHDLDIGSAAGRIYWANYNSSKISYADLNGGGAGGLGTGVAVISNPPLAGMKVQLSPARRQRRRDSDLLLALVQGRTGCPALCDWCFEDPQAVG